MKKITIRMGERIGAVIEFKVVGEDVKAIVAFAGTGTIEAVALADIELMDIVQGA